MKSTSAHQLRAQFEIRRSVATVLRCIEAGRRPSQSPDEVSQQLLVVDRPASAGEDRWALAQALRSLDKAIAWEPAVEAADANAAAYREASRYIAEKALDTPKRGAWSTAVCEALQMLAQLNMISEVHCAIQALQRAPITFPSIAVLTTKGHVPAPEGPSPDAQPPQETPGIPTVLLKFTLDDRPVSWPMALQAGRLYRIKATAIMDEWPEEWTNIEINWESSVPNTVLEQQGFSISRDGKCGDSGYLIARAEIPSNRGVDLVPRVAIHGVNTARYRANVIGQRSLRVNTFTPSDLGVGLPMVAQRIVELTGELDARIPSLPKGDRLNILHLLDATTRFAALANEQKELSGISEKDFQAKVKQALTMDSRIGLRIQEAPKLGGGETDLFLERIVNELKVSRSPIDLESASKLAGQPMQYASAGDCPISMLTILDDSPKTEPPGIQSNYMGWVYPQVHGVGPAHIPSMVAVVIIPVGFPVPSAWKKTPIHRNRCY